MAKRPDARDLDRELESRVGATGIATLVELVAATTLWVHPEIVRSVPVVFPATRRKSSGEVRGAVIDGVRIHSNMPSQEAFWAARGEKKNAYVNATVCHLYRESPKLPEHNTHLANLCVMPQGLESLSEWPPIAAALQRHAYDAYGYAGPLGKEPAIPAVFPRVWTGVREHTPDEIERIVTKLRHLRDNRPMYSAPRGAAEIPAAVQAAVLEYLARGGGKTKNEIAAAVGKSNPHVNAVLKRLGAMGKVTKSNDPLKPMRLIFTLASP